MHSQPPQRGQNTQPPWPNDPYAQQPPGDPYQQPGWQPPPGGPHQARTGGTHQPPKPPRKRRLGLKITLGIVGGFILLIIVAGVLGGNKSSTGTGSNAASSPAAGNSSSPAAQASASTVAGIGDPVRDGKFQFVITKITHAKSVGDTADGLGDTAQGEYTILHIKVTNIGNQAQTLDDSTQFVYDSQGRKFDASSSADIDINGTSNSVFLNDINPGNTVRGKIAFDLPAGDTAVKAELHDSMFSDGVTVTLSK